MSPELSQLIELQELDLEIQRISDRLSKIPEERDRTENEFKQHAAEFLDLKSKHERTLEDRQQLEAELATTQQNQEKFERDKTRVQNEKEYTGSVGSWSRVPNSTASRPMLGFANESARLHRPY